MRSTIKRRRAMTLIEFLVVLGLVGLGLTFTSGLYTHYLDRSKADAALGLIAALARAATVYQESTGDFPPGRMDGSCDRALSALRGHADAAPHLGDVSGPWLRLVDGLPRCVDPWGMPVRYLTAQSDHPEHRRRLLAAGGRPIFESAGADRDFGDINPSARIDNIRSDDPE